MMTQTRHSEEGGGAGLKGRTYSFKGFTLRLQGEVILHGG